MAYNWLFPVLTFLAGCLITALVVFIAGKNKYKDKREEEGRSADEN